MRKSIRKYLFCLNYKTFKKRERLNLISIKPISNKVETCNVKYCLAFLLQERDIQFDLQECFPANNKLFLLQKYFSLKKGEISISFQRNVRICFQV